MSTLVPVAGYRSVATQRGDSLQSFAAREMGDASRWTDIAAINGLSPPFLTDNVAHVRAGVVLSGSALLVPGGASAPSAVVGGAVLGTDIALVDGKLTGASGDFGTVSGPANVAAALDRRIRTPLGEMIFHLTYGCRIGELLGRGNSPALLQLAGAFVSSAALQDPRIAAAAMTAAVAGDQISVTGTAATVDGRVVPAAVVLG